MINWTPYYCRLQINFSKSSTRIFKSLCFRRASNLHRPASDEQKKAISEAMSLKDNQILENDIQVATSSS